jgi:hypothetical protein
MKYQNRNDPSPEANFMIGVTTEAGHNLVIAQTKERPWVVIAAKVVADPSKDAKEHSAILLAPDSTFIPDLNVELAHLGVDYRIFPEKKPMEVGVERKVTFDDSITDLTFMREVVVVEGAINIVTGVAARVLIAAKARKGTQLLPASKRDR